MHAHVPPLRPARDLPSPPCAASRALKWSRASGCAGCPPPWPASLSLNGCCSGEPLPHRFLSTHVAVQVRKHGTCDAPQMKAHVLAAAEANAHCVCFPCALQPPAHGATAQPADGFVAGGLAGALCVVSWSTRGHVLPSGFLLQGMVQHSGIAQGHACLALFHSQAAPVPVPPSHAADPSGGGGVLAAPPAARALPPQPSRACPLRKQPQVPGCAFARRALLYVPPSCSGHVRCCMRWLPPHAATSCLPPLLAAACRPRWGMQPWEPPASLAWTSLATTRTT